MQHHPSARRIGEGWLYVGLSLRFEKKSLALGEVGQTMGTQNIRKHQVVVIY